MLTCASGYHVRQHRPRARPSGLAGSRHSTVWFGLSLSFAFFAYWAHPLQKERYLHLSRQDDPQVIPTYIVFVAHGIRGKDNIVLIALFGSPDNP